MEKIKVIAPTRIDFSGGFTDVEPFSSYATGEVVNAAINRYSHVYLKRRKDDKIDIWSHDLKKKLCITRENIVYDGNLDLLKAVIKELNFSSGLEGEIYSDVPSASGLGTSASVCVALVYALTRLEDKIMPKEEIAETAYKIESLINRGGRQDQYAAALGGINYMIFGNERKIEKINLTKKTIKTLEKKLCLVYTGKTHLSGSLINDVMGNYENKLKETTFALYNLKRIPSLMKVELEQGNIDLVGKLIAENWENQKRLDNSITNSEIDKYFDYLKNETCGGKATGAGGGGSLLFVAKNNRKDILERLFFYIANKKLNHLKFKFDFQGVRDE